jgi:molybdate transport system permease protein
MRSWFHWVLALAVGLSVSLMAMLIVVQALYSGGAETFRALAQPDIQHSLFLGFTTATIATVLAVALALPTGFALARWKFPGVWLIEALLLIPVVMSPMALGVAILLLLGSPPGRWFEDHVFRLMFTPAGIVVAQFFVAYAFAALILRTTFAGIDVRLEQVARFLGCTRWQAFRRITLPLARNGILAAFVLGWTRSMGDFGTTSTVAGAVKGYTETPPITIYFAMQSLSTERAVALSIVLTLLCVTALIAVRLLLGGRRS